MQRFWVDRLDVAGRVDVVRQARIDQRQHDDADDAGRDGGPAKLGTEDALLAHRHGSAHRATRQEYKGINQEPRHQHQADGECRERQRAARNFAHHALEEGVVSLRQARAFIRWRPRRGAHADTPAHA